MAVGLEIYDAGGNALWSSSDRLARFLGSIATNAANGSTNIAEFSQGTPFAFFLPTDDGFFSSPNISFSGTTLTWAYISTGSLIFYGVR